MVDLQNLRDTQISWIGHIPAHWGLKKIKYVFWERKENNNPIQTENLISLTIERGVIPHSEKIGGGNKPKEDLTKYKIVRPGDIVLNSMNVIAGAVGISKYFGIVSPVYYMLIPVDQGSTKEYFHHLFRTELFQKSLYGLGNGILIKENDETGKLNTIRMRIPMDKLGDQLIPVPPLDEQKIISRYLDKKTSQINLLVNKIEKKIELLKEQRTSLINQCVTKGLDPNVEMKDSGVEWIGEIPKHWRVIKLKYFSEIKTGRDPSSIYLEEGQFDVLGTGGVIGKTNTPMYEHTSLILGRKGTIDKPFIQTRPFWISDVVYYTIPKGYIDPKYLWFLYTQIDFTYYKYGSTLPSMSSQEYENMKFPLPPENEVRSIQARLNEIDSRINSLISSLEKKTSLLKEYRQSLISSTVTGKVRVTEEMI
ncbi:MAG: restriction endonuclease subunit S [Polynucleobacter sp.]|nr:restriction endonuclease subunit S [Polynucleobacter sp.]